MKRILIFSGITGFAIGLSNLAFAMNCHGSDHQSSSAATDEHSRHAQDASAGQTTKAIVNAGNKICPVTGEKIQEKTMATSEYDGKIYNFCCAACIDEFKKDPEKYTKKVEEEIKVTSKNEK